MSKKQKTTENSTTITTPTNPTWVESGLEQQMKRIGDFASADPFSFVAGPSALQNQAFSVVGGLGSYVPELFRGASDAARAAAAYRAPTVSAQSVSPTAAFGSMGAADPTAALARSLSGSVDNPYLAAMNQASVNQAMQGYDDALASAGRSLTRQALPAIRSGAMLSGQYGGSRQGIAEGVALSDFGVQSAQNARNLAQSALDSGAQLYGGAYENAQNRAAQTAASLAGMALENSRANADRSLQADTTNAGAGLNAAQLNLAGGQQMAGLSQSALDALGSFGATQQQLDALYRRAPLDLLQATTGMYGQLPLDLFKGSNQTFSGVTRNKTYGLGNALEVGGNLANSVANLLSAWPGKGGK